MNEKKVNVQMLEPQPNNGIRTIDTTSSQTIAKPHAISSAEKKHRWSKALKKFCDGESYCLDCGLLRERHGLLGTWYSNSKTDVHGWGKQLCIPSA